MSTYAIGDVQGCYKELIQLLEKINFNKTTDSLWFTGDLVNRGPQSEEVVHFVKSLGDRAITVLGNHDLHYCAKNLFSSKALFDWMRHRPLIHYDQEKNFLLVHAGIPPHWTLQQALESAHKVENILRSENYQDYFNMMYDGAPDNELKTITDYLTRMRYVDERGQLNLAYKGPIGGQPKGYFPWFQRGTHPVRIIFGHWASLQGKTNVENVFALDTGCCWGKSLTALRLEDLNYFSVKCNYCGVKNDESS